MSFQKIQFTYTPPPTALPQAVSGQAGTILPATASKNDLAKLSRAAALIDRLRDLKATAKYLESLLVAKSAGIGVHPNYGVTPDLALVMSRLYSSPLPPAGISMAMYVNLLTAEMGITRAEIVLAGRDSQLKVSPNQKADLMTATLAFEDALADTGLFRHQLPLLIREVQGDELIFDALIGGLEQYPILRDSEYAPEPPTATATVVDNGDWMTAEQQSLESLIDTSKLQVKNAAVATNGGIVTNLMSSASVYSASYNTGTTQPLFATTDQVLIDVNQQTTAELNLRLDKYQSVYGAMYNLATEIDEAYSCVSQIANEYLYKDLNELMLVVAAMSSLIAMVHKPSLKELKGLIGVMIMPRLIAEVGVFNMLIDRVEQRVLGPVQQILNSMNNLIGEVSRDLKSVAYLAAGGGLTGMVSSSISGTNKMPAPKQMKALDALPKFMRLITGKVAWALNEITRKRATVEDGMLKSMDRKLAGSGNRLDLLKTMRSIESLSSVIQNLILERQRGSLQNVSQPSATQQVEAVANIVGNLGAGSGTSYSVQGGVLMAQAPDLPAPPDKVIPVLSAGGANRIDSSSLQRIQMDTL